MSICWDCDGVVIAAYEQTQHITPCVELLESLESMNDFDWPQMNALGPYPLQISNSSYGCPLSTATKCFGLFIDHLSTVWSQQRNWQVICYWSSHISRSWSRCCHMEKKKGCCPDINIHRWMGTPKTCTTPPTTIKLHFTAFSLVNQKTNFEQLLIGLGLWFS